MSSSALQSGLEEAGVAADDAQEIENIYALSRTQAFKSGAGLLFYATLLGLVVSLWLPKRKLVDMAEGPPEESMAARGA
jgi:hypothetical protein